MYEYIFGGVSRVLKSGKDEARELRTLPGSCMVMFVVLVVCP